jgi:hypothetical protein
VSSSSGPWYWANIGFDTTKKLWFVDLYDNKGMIKMYIAKNVILKNGSGVQYQWPDRGPRAFWHVRERIFANDVRSISYDNEGNLIVESVSVEAPDEDVPRDYSYVTYAYSLKTTLLTAPRKNL